MQNRNFILIHGCPGSEEKALNPATRTYDKHWQPWILKELQTRSFKVDFPLMPKPWEPVYDDYKKVLDVLDINENTVLVATSCGTAFVVRYLGDTKKKIDKLILVAPWKIPTDDSEIKKNLYNFEIDKSIKDRVKEIVFFTSDTERELGKKSLMIYHDSLGGEVINLSKRGHYIFKDMGTEEFPELLEKCLE